MAMKNYQDEFKADVLAFAHRLTSLCEATGPNHPAPVPGEPTVSTALYARAQLPPEKSG
ncbi:hypothetical protein AB0D83_27830 [Streptomyces decoyicus]|uniref:hypothetical protein n=1 Tax=Streptomyces decoyicus TaxID=249567 RepID=UPI0033CF7EE5